jgi:hypothetical protein
MPQWWNNLSPAGRFLVGLATVLAVVVGAAAILESRRQHDQDRQQHERELTANLVQDGQPYEKDGYIHLLFRNTSPQGTAVISTVWFVINDQKQLALIERVHPKPMPTAPSDEPAMCGAMIEPEDAFFRNGQWHDDRFVYSCYEPRQAPKMNGILLKLAIFDDKLAGREMNGVIVLDYNSDQQIESSPLSIPCYREKSKQDANPQSELPPKPRKWFRPFRR